MDFSQSQQSFSLQLLFFAFPEVNDCGERNWLIVPFSEWKKMYKNIEWNKDFTTLYKQKGGYSFHVALHVYYVGVYKKVSK